MQQIGADEQRRPGKQRADIGRDDRPQEGERAEAGDEVEGEIHAQHEEIPLGEIDDPHHPEDETEAYAHQAIDAADKGARRQRLQKGFNGRAEHAQAAISANTCPSANGSSRFVEYLRYFGILRFAIRGAYSATHKCVSADSRPRTWDAC